MGYFLLVLLIIVFVFSAFGFYSAFNIAHNKKKPDFDMLQYSYPWHDQEYEKEIKEWIKSLNLNYIKIRSPYFYKLNALVLRNNDAEKWIVILHGVTLNHKALMDMAYMYTNLGYNILLWDSRNHGESGGKNISYGYYEKHDLKAVIDYMRESFGEKIKIGIQGVSMGSGILLSYATGVRDDCSFYVADCPYSNMSKQIFNVSKKKLKMPDFIVKIIMFFSQIFLRMFFKLDIGKVDIAGRCHRMENPAIFITCRDDDYIDPEMTKELYDKCASETKKLVMFDIGGHGGAFPKNKEEYIKTIKEFLVEIDF